MTSVVIQTLIAAGSSLTTSIVAKATVATAIALLTARLARRSRASVQHLVFVAAFVALLIIPIATMILPRVDVPLATFPDPGQAVPQANAVDQAAAAPLQAAAAPMNATTEIHLPISLNAVFIVLWGVAAAIFLLPVAVGLWQLYDARRSARPWLTGERLVEELISSAGIRRPVAVLLHESVTGPMTCGLFRPMILFPRSAPTWDNADVRRALIHELEHIRRADWLVHCIVRTICAFYWFHPLVWMSWRQLRLAAECACDDAVLRDGEPIGYAKQLVALAERLSPESNRPLLAMASRRDLPARVTAVLDRHQQRGRTAGIWITATLAFTLLLALVIAPVRAIARIEIQSTQAKEKLAFEVASIKPYSGRGPYGLSVLPGGRVTGRFGLFWIISSAYGINSKQLEGNAAVLDEFFEIDAKAPPNVLPDEEPRRPEDAEPGHRPFQLMMQTLLEDRFKLAIHKEVRELPVYALVIAKNGHRMKPMLPDWVCPANEKCGFGGGPGGGLSGHPEISMLAAALSVFVDRPVIDRTGLKGRFEVTLPSWNPTNPVGTQVRLDDNLEPQPNPNDASIFTVLQESLGLKLDATRAPLDVYIVDHVERPESN